MSLPYTLPTELILTELSTYQVTRKMSYQTAIDRDRIILQCNLRMRVQYLSVVDT